MLIRSLAIQNFRSCESVVLDVDQLTSIVGANGCGKSAVLRALELFYSPTPKFSPEDFFAHDASRDIEITVTFGSLSTAELTRFSAYAVENELAVTRVLVWQDGRATNRLHGSRLGNKEFTAVRAASSATAAKTAYSALVSRGFALPRWTNRPDSDAALAAWESAHQEDCQRTRDEGGFFGFKEVGQGYLGRSTRLLFIPAVRDAASDAQDGKGSVIAELMDLVVRKTLSEHPDYRQFLEETRKRYHEVFDVAKFEEVGALSGRLTSSLRTFVPGADVNITWETSDLDLPLPRASVRVSEDGFATNISACGHGLQRAFILTLLQHLAAAQPGQSEPVLVDDNTTPPEAVENDPIPDLVLVIEEPELFQHPSRQRHFAEVLGRFASGNIPGVARRAQVIYCTHSPHFVGIDRFDQVRILRRVAHADSGQPKVTRVRYARVQGIARALARACEEDPTEHTEAGLLARLAPLMTMTTSEGFFADVAVLVEGESDRAAVLGAARSMGVFLESDGVAVIPCAGKSNVLNIAAVYREFGIATYSVWDGDAEMGESEGNCSQCHRPLDKKPDPKQNQRLFRLHSAPAVDWPPTSTGETFACFHRDLETTLEQEIGQPLFNSILDDVKGTYGLTKRSQATKNSLVMAEVLRRAREQGKSSLTLEVIVRRIQALRVHSPEHSQASASAPTPALPGSVA